MLVCDLHLAGGFERLSRGKAVRFWRFGRRSLERSVLFLYRCCCCAGRSHGVRSEE